MSADVNISIGEDHFQSRFSDACISVHVWVLLGVVVVFFVTKSSEILSFVLGFKVRHRG